MESQSIYLKKVGDKVGLSVTEDGGESAVDPRESLCICNRLKLSDFGLRWWCCRVARDCGGSAT